MHTDKTQRIWFPGRVFFEFPLAKIRARRLSLIGRATDLCSVGWWFDSASRHHKLVGHWCSGLTCPSFTEKIAGSNPASCNISIQPWRSTQEAEGDGLLNR